MRIYYILIMAGMLFACNNSTPKQQPHHHDDPVFNTKYSDAETAGIDSNLIFRLYKRLDSANLQERDFIYKMLSLIEGFKNRRLDTIVFTIGNIAGENLMDTIKTRIYYKDHTVWVQYNWIKIQDTLWNFQIKNPYIFIANCDLYLENRSVWEIFTVGVFEVIPKIKRFDEYKHLFRTSILELNYANKTKDFKIDLTDYKNYLQRFKGNLMEWGDQAYTEGLYIWYAPEKKLIPFYTP